MPPFFGMNVPSPQVPVKPLVDSGEYPCKLCGQILLKNLVSRNWESEETLDVCEAAEAGIKFLHSPAIRYLG